ncbi:hypothetical protein BpHYR1_022711 [Brachionus plicatilis]|uniref:Uncharacterized protein n=1 Tax=Brachionus plicatilis TaxID=10195 RepID=A0A3M7T6Y1_BRAPC|nr:hypothetical protein BpHYR1_022711 [Brachionus plicatilis]
MLYMLKFILQFIFQNYLYLALKIKIKFKNEFQILKFQKTSGDVLRLVNLGGPGRSAGLGISVQQKELGCLNNEWNALPAKHRGPPSRSPPQASLAFNNRINEKI